MKKFSIHYVVRNAVLIKDGDETSAGKLSDYWFAIPNLSESAAALKVKELEADSDVDSTRIRLEELSS